MKMDKIEVEILLSTLNRKEKYQNMKKWDKEKDSMTKKARYIKDQCLFNKISRIENERNRREINN